MPTSVMPPNKEFPISESRPGRVAGSGRIVAIVVGAVLFGVFLVGVTNWRTFATNYHLRRLRSDTSYLYTIFGEPRGTSAREAIRRWVNEDLGGREIGLPQSGPAADVGVHIAGASARELVRSLSDYTGMATIADREVFEYSTSRVLEAPELECAQLVALLAAEGFRVRADTLPSGRRLVRVGPSGGDKKVERRLLQSLPKAPTAPGGRIDVAEGDIALIELQHFLTDWTGVEVKSAVGDGTVHVAAPITDIDGEMIVVLLEANGFAVEHEVKGGVHRVGIRRIAEEADAR